MGKMNGIFEHREQFKRDLAKIEADLVRTSMRCTLEQIKAKKQHIIVVSDEREAKVYKQAVKLAPINISIVPTLKRKEDSVSLNS